MNKFEKILLTVFFIELFIGGGGRLIDFGILSIRQVLFLLVLVTFMIRIVKQRSFLDRSVNTFIRFNAATIGAYLMLGWYAVSAVIGFVNGHSLSMIFTDFMRVSFFVLYFPLAYYISDTRFSKERIISLLKYGALIVAIFTITIDILGKTVFSSNFAPFYYFMNDIMNDDLFFRPSNSVFYKSHLFVLIGLVISLNAILSKKFTPLDWINVILCSVSLIWSETRGFLLAFMVSAFMIAVLDTKVITDQVKGLIEKVKLAIKSPRLVRKMSTLLIIIIAVPFLYQSMTLGRFEVEQSKRSSNHQFYEDEWDEEIEEPVVNDESVNTRMEFIVDSKDILLDNPVAAIIGTGYGKEIAGRPAIEMSFLEILVEQGAIGLGIWCFLFFLVYYNYYYSYKKGEKLTTLDISLLAAFMGVLLLTNINPFINNPIGMIFFLFVIVLSQNKRDSLRNEVVS
ncbi:hypothetical protein FZW96_07210 [Bacillus sp. BGMRC 2118]|nr:hypothetical protein FZW96_07210 [Bacillus sp. BGMRC 2118]